MYIVTLLISGPPRCVLVIEQLQQTIWWSSHIHSLYNRMVNTFLVEGVFFSYFCVIVNVFNFDKVSFSDQQGVRYLHYYAS